MASDADAIRDLILLLEPLDDRARERIWAAVATYFKLGAPDALGSRTTTPEVRPAIEKRPLFSEDRSLSVKEVLLQKQPHTDVERIACLAYYLTHYRDMPHFTTADLNQLNVEAAQPRLSNPSFTVSNAVKMGYLTTAAKGTRQLSAAGEQFVLALPDRDAARKAMERFRPRRRPARRANGEG